MGTSAAAREFADLYGDMMTRVKALEMRRNLAHASIDGGALPVYDNQGNLQMSVGILADGTFGTTHYNPNPPPKPAQPTVTPTWGGLTVAHFGTSADGQPWPLDVARIEVHLSTFDLFFPSPATLVGTLEQVNGGGVYAAMGLEPGTTYYVRLVAVNTSDKVSEPTDAVSAVPDSVVTQEELDQIDADLNAAVDDLVAAVSTKSGTHHNNVAAGDPVPTATSTSDVWFRPDEDYKAYRWDGTEWVPFTFGAEAIAAGAITTEKLVNGAVTADALADAVADTLTQASTDASAAQGRLDTVETDLGAVAADLETTTTDVAGLATRVADTEGDVTDIVTVQLPGKNKVTWSAVPPNGAANTAGDTWNVIANGKTTEVWRGAGSTNWTKMPIDGAALADINAATITAGTLAAARIGAGTVTAEKIAIGDFTNLVVDGDLTDPTFSQWSGTGLTRVAPSGTTPGYMEWTTPSVGNAHVYNQHTFEVKPGDQFQFYGEVSTPAENTADVNVTAGLQTRNATGTIVTWPSAGGPRTLTPGTDWTELRGIFTIPAGASVSAKLSPFASSNGTAQKVRMRNMTVRRMTTGELIVDGAVTATKLAAGSVTAEKLTIADFTNYASGSDFEGTHPWTLPTSGATIDSTVARGGTKSLKISSALSGSPFLTAGLKVAEGDKFYVEAYVMRDAAWNGTNLSRLRLARKSPDLFLAQLDLSAAGLPLADTWYKKSAVVTIPAGVTDVSAIIHESATAGNLWIDDIVIRRMVGGELIVDGSIKASMVHADGLDAGSIKTGTMSADRIDANTLTIGKVKDLSTTLAGKATPADIEAAKSTNHGYRYKADITIGGDHDKYYPVIITGNDQTVKRDLLVKRSYSELHPPEWNSATHGGGLTLKLKWNFGGWGGATYSWEVHELEEQYNPTFAGAMSGAISGMAGVVFLRGGGAVYHLYSDQPLATGQSNLATDDGTGTLTSIPLPFVPIEPTTLIYKTATQYTWATPPVRTRSAADIEEIRVRKFISLAKEVDTTVNGWKVTGQTTIDGGKIATDTVAAAQIKAGAVVASKLAVGDTANMAEINEATSLGALYDTVHTITSFGWSTRSSTTSTYFMFRNQKGPLQFKTGDRLRITFEAYCTSGTTPAPPPRLWVYGNASEMQTATAVAGSPADLTSAAQTFTYEMPVTVDTKGKTSYLVGLSGVEGQVIYLRNVRVYRMGAGELIVDGSIKTAHLDAGAVTADKVAANAITANKLNVVMGGGNLWSNSSFEDPTDYMAGWAKYDNAAIATASKVAGRLAGSAVRLTWTATPTSALLGLFRKHPTGFKAGTTTTLSFYAKATGSAVGKTMAIAGNDTFVGTTWASNPPLTESWQRYVVSFSRPTDTNDSVYFGVGGLSGAAAGTVEYDDIQLEHGDVVTAYAPQVDEILPGTIQTAMVAAGAIKTEQLFADAVTASKIKAGEVNAGHLAAGSITTEKLSVGSIGDNLILNGNFRDVDNNGAPIGWLSESAQSGTFSGLTAGTDTYMQVVTPAAPAGSIFQHLSNGLITAKPGDQFHIDVGCVSNTSGGQFVLGLHTYNRDGTYQGAVMSEVRTAGDATTINPPVSRHSVVVTVPSGGDVSGVRFAIWCQSANRTYYFDKFTVGKVSVSARIADGAITADKIKAKAVVADKIDTNAVTATKVAAGAITADKIHIGSKAFGVNDNANFEQTQLDASLNPINRPYGWWMPYVTGGSPVFGLETANPISGTQSGRVDMPAANMTARIGTATDNSFPVVPGEKWYVSVRVKAVGGNPVPGSDTHLTFHGAPSDPAITPFGLSGTSWLNGAAPDGSKQIADGQEVTLTGTFTVPANRVRAGVSVRLGERSTAGYYLIEDFVAHPAVDNTMVTDISAGKLTTGFIQAGQKILAGASETGARLEMNSAGLFGYNAAGAVTFGLWGSNGNASFTGSITGSTITGSTMYVGDTSSIHMTLGAAANWWNGNISSAMLKFNYPNSGWGEGNLFAQYWTTGGYNWAALRLQSPYTGDPYANAAYVDVRNRNDGHSEVLIRAKTMQTTANTMLFSATDGNVVDFTLQYTNKNVFSFRSPNAAGVIDMSFGEGTYGTVQTIKAFHSAYASNATLRLQGHYLEMRSLDVAETFQVSGAQQGFMWVGVVGRGGLRFGDAKVHVQDWSNDSWKVLRAWSYETASDPALKSNARKVEAGSLDRIRKVEVQDYNVLGAEKDSRRFRGVMADQMEEHVPEAVVRDDDSDMMGVDLYALLATTMAALQELADEVDVLRGDASARHKPTGTGSK